MYPLTAIWVFISVFNSSPFINNEQQKEEEVLALIYADFMGSFPKKIGLHL